MSTSLQSARQRNKNRQHNSSRGGYQNANSYRRETPEPEAPSGIHADHRSTVMMCSILGTQSTIKTVNGKTYKGRTTAFSDKFDIAMADARLEDEDGTLGPNLPGITIPKDSFVVCKTNGVDLKGFCSSSDFTDSGIVSRLNGSSESQLKELQPWQDDDANEISSTLTLDDHTGGWDSESMFEENFQKFNVKTAYDESMHEYTTRLPEPGSEAYEAKERFAKEKAEEIERDDGYQRRIAKELSDHDEDSRFSFVHRDESHSPHRSHEGNSGKNMPNMYPPRQAFPPLRGDRDRDRERDEHLRNGNLHNRGQQGRGSMQRQNSPYSSSSGGGHSSMQHSGGHHPVHNSRQSVNNHYQQGSMSSNGPPNRNQGHLRQQQQQHQGLPPSSSQNHSGPSQSSTHHHHQYSSQQPQHVSQGSLHRISQHQQQVVSPTQPPPGKPPHHLPTSQQTVPSSSPLSSSSSSPVQSCNHPQSLQKASNQQQQLQSVKAAPSQAQAVNGVSAHQLRQGVTQLNGDSVQAKTEQKIQSGPVPELASAIVPSVVSSSAQFQPTQLPPTSPPSTMAASIPAAPTNSGPLPSLQKTPTGGNVPSAASSSSSSVPPPVSKSTPSPPSSSVSSTAHAGRSGRGSEGTPEEARNKLADLQDFKEKFVLEPPRQEESGESAPSQVPPSSVVQPSQSQPLSTTDTSTSTTSQLSASEQSSSTETTSGEKKEEETTPAIKTSKLNPNAKEFKPKAPVEAQSPSPQPRSSPQVHQVVQYPTPSPIMMQLPPASYAIMHQNPQRKRATVSLQANVDHLTHQVTGQPLLATQPPMAPMMYIQGAPGASLPAGYQIMGRMPNSLTMAQGQHAAMDQGAAQNQPQPMFVPAQQQPIPAHLPHPQPAHHAGPLQQQPPVQQAQPAHVPNPAPSPVHHQQQHPGQQPHSGGQPGMQPPQPHHQMGQQGPPQSVTPQPHYMNFQPHGMPRTSGGNQQGLASHPAVSISYNISGAPQYTNYQNATSGAQYSFAPAAAAAAAAAASATQAQPQTSQNSSHGQGGGTHPQYVMMPHTTPQGHPPLQQHSGQAYPAAGLQFHPQHNLMQGPPQIPPSHGHNSSQGGPHLLQTGMPAGIHQQVAGSQPGMFMQMPSAQQLFQHQQ